MNIQDMFPKKNGSHGKPLPQPNVDVRMSGDTREWTAEQVRGIVCNPLYAGIGPFPGLVSDEQWVRGAAQVIAEEGSEQFLVDVLAVLRACLKDAHL
jgi:hypothetical protein